MDIKLRPEQERILERLAESGIGPQEALDQAFAVIQQQHEDMQWMREERDRIAAQVEAGFQQSERGELIDAEEAVRILQERRKKRQIA